MVGLDGLEPSTSRLSGVRSNHLSYKPLLEYSDFQNFPFRKKSCFFYLIGAAGFEPAALWSQTRCATKLRYAPIKLAGDEGIEPPLMVLETTVMPLDQSPIFQAWFKKYNGEGGI